MFIDEIKIYAKAGHGGKGCVAFLREAFRPKGGPIGGNGGRGGSVILRASHDINNLIAQFYQPRLIAGNGMPGLGKGMDGSAGKDLIIPVPCGTLVWKKVSVGADPTEQEAEEEELNDESDVDSSIPLPIGGAGRPVFRSSQGQKALEINLEEDEEIPPDDHDTHTEGRELVADLIEHDQEFILCRGGRGGLGNRNFATSRRQTPKFAQPGEPGEEGEYEFELRIMAEVGLVGYPNAGKSTLLTALSRARPKIAPYPFTTLHPQIGIVEYEDFKRLTVCDIPGIIEGAHMNVGLGHEFLRHIQRCKILILLVDMAGIDARQPEEDFSNILKELELYSPELLSKPLLVAANKMDEEVAEENLVTFRKSHPEVEIMEISAAFGQGMEAFKLRIRSLVEEHTQT